MMERRRACSDELEEDARGQLYALTYLEDSCSLQMDLFGLLVTS